MEVISLRGQAIIIQGICFLDAFFEYVFGQIDAISALGT